TPPGRDVHYALDAVGHFKVATGRSVPLRADPAVRPTAATGPWLPLRARRHNQPDTIVPQCHVTRVTGEPVLGTERGAHWGMYSPALTSSAAPVISEA